MDVEESAFIVGEDNPLVGGRPVIAGVVDPEPGIGGNDSSKEAPKDEEGLKGFNPENPVRCDFTGEVEDCVENDIFVVPVG